MKSLFIYFERIFWKVSSMQSKEISKNLKEYGVFWAEKIRRIVWQEKIYDYFVIFSSKNDESQKIAREVNNFFLNQGLSGQLIEHHNFSLKDIDFADIFVFTEEIAQQEDKKEYINKINKQNKSRLVLTNYKNLSLLSGFLASRAKKLVFIIPGTKISGGIMVIYQYVKYLVAKGYNISMVNQGISDSLIWAGECDFPIISYDTFKRSKINLMDAVLATHWSTVTACLETKSKKKFYLVQNREDQFYPTNSSSRKSARLTYQQKELIFLTVSRWCQSWLKEEFNQESTYIPNGIDTNLFHKIGDYQRFNNSKIRILIEGNSNDKNKNVDEAFQIVKKLDKNKFEIWFISYGGKPRNWYHCDKFFQAVPHTKMPELYSQCDILLKTSVLESFSYPPLEMMACGGIGVVAENEGNREYVKGEYNALTYKSGDIEKAVLQIDRIVEDRELKNRLVANGHETAQNREWIISVDILSNIIDSHLSGRE